MKCESCDHNNSEWARNCDSCGLLFRRKKQEEPEEVIEEQIQETPSYPYAHAMKAYHGIVHTKSDITYRLWGAYVCIMLIPIILNIEQLHLYYKKITLWGIILLTLFGIATFFINIIHSRHYYSVPTSIDKKKQHRCIFCGHTKIHKQYILTTSIASHHCESCGKFLFYK